MTHRVEKLHAVLPVAVLVATACVLWPHPVAAQSVAEWHTTMGDFRVELREDLVPITAGNFMDLTNANFYDGCIFHRVIDTFVIQDGDPTGTGEGGPGYTIPDEFHPDLRHDDAGILSMANAGPNTGGSQYFITLSPQPHLDDLHAVFGKVISGINVVQAIGDVPTDVNDRPLVDVVIDSLRILGIIFPHIHLAQTTIIEDPANADNDGIMNPLESGQVTIDMRNWAGWLDADDVVATLSCDDTRIMITNDRYEFGNVANGDSATNAEDPFIFTITANEVFFTTFQVQFSANSGTDEPYEISYDVDLDVTLHQAGWPVPLRSSTSALIANIDNDGSNELIFGDYSGQIHAFRADGQTELPGFPVSLGGSIQTSAAIGDITGDETMEIIVTKRTGDAIVAVDHAGTVLFTRDVDEQLGANPMIADVDGDGSSEIIAITTTTGQILVLNADGTDFGVFPMAIGSRVQSSPAIADLNGDGALELLAVSDADGGSLHAISTATGSDILGWPFVTGSKSANGPIVTDIDGDMEPEVIVGLENGNLVAVNHDGAELFTRDAEISIKTSVVAADLDKDHDLELIFLNRYGALYVIDGSGTDFPNFPLDIDAVVQSTPVLADLNGDGTIDIIFGDALGFIHAIDIHGAEIENFPLPIGQNLKYSPCLGDLDQDGDLEIVASDGADYFCVDYKRAAEVIWPCFKGNSRRTGNTNDIPTRAVDGWSVGPKQTTLEYSYPNPFTPPAAIRFCLADPRSVRLSIFTIAGHEVRSLVRGNLSPGEYTISWDGANNHGLPVGSGHYVYRLVAGDYTAAGRLILIR